MKQFSEKGFRGRNALREMPVVGHDQKLDFGQRPHSQLAADVADGLRQNLLQRFGRLFHVSFSLSIRVRESRFSTSRIVQSDFETISPRIFSLSPPPAAGCPPKAPHRF